MNTGIHRQKTITRRTKQNRKMWSKCEYSHNTMMMMMMMMMIIIIIIIIITIKQK